MVTDVGGFCEESGVNLEMGGDHDEYSEGILRTAGL